MNKDFYIFGAGGHGHDILAIFSGCGDADYYPIFRGFFDDNSPLSLGTFKDNYKTNSRDKYCAIGLNWPEQRIKVIRNMHGWNFLNIIHAKADRGCDTTLGRGIVIGAFTSLGWRSNIRDHTHIGANVSIHRGDIGEFTTICPGATICGDVKIGKGVTIGAGATVSNLVNIGDGAFIGAGAVVIEDVEPYSKVAGVPAKLI